MPLKPQAKQEQFLSSPADIAIYGGSAGGGKTWALLVEPLRHIANPNFGAVIFRRTIQEVIKTGGLWDEAGDIYPLLGARPNANEHQFTFPGGAQVTFGHMQYDTTLASWRGAQIPLIEFDQLETFTSRQFFYMLSRNRSTCGVKPYIRATCNPEPGWLADFLDYWIAPDGYADLSRSGNIRYFIRQGNNILWSDTPGELKRRHPGTNPKSVTFILSTVFDNQILLDADPGYLANLQALDFVERERLLGDAKRGGNWKIKPSAGKLFNRSWFKVVDALPDAPGVEVRYWDLAATEKENQRDDPDFTAGVRMKKIGNSFYITGLFHEQLDPAQTDEAIKRVANQDGKACRVRWEQEPGASGKRDSYHIATALSGFDARGMPSTGDKIMRARAFAAQALAGNVYLLRAPWNETYLNELHGQPELPHDDIMDGSSGAFNSLEGAGETTAIPNPFYSASEE